MSGSIVNDVPQGKVGTETFRTLDLLNTAQNISLVRCNLFSIFIRNRGAAERFVKLYNKASATSADTPIATYSIPNGVEPLVIDLPKGMQFNTACSIRGTTGIADNDNVAPTTNDLVVVIQFKQSAAPVV